MDGIVGDDAIMEVKCPILADKYATRQEAHANKKLPYCVLVDNKPLLKKSSNYFYQFQRQLHITKRNRCYFVLYTKHWLSYEIIERDQLFWETNMAPQLERFYMNCYLPELVNPQSGIRLLVADIKDPGYIIDAQRAAEQQKAPKKV